VKRDLEVHHESYESEGDDDDVMEVPAPLQNSRPSSEGTISPVLATSDGGLKRGREINEVRDSSSSKKPKTS